MVKGHLAACEQSSQDFSDTWDLFGHKLWEMGTSKNQEEGGSAAGSSFALAPAAELEGRL